MGVGLEVGRELAPADEPGRALGSRAPSPIMHTLTASPLEPWHPVWAPEACLALASQGPQQTDSGDTEGYGNVVVRGVWLAV